MELRQLPTRRLRPASHRACTSSDTPRRVAPITPVRHGVARDPGSRREPSGGALLGLLAGALLWLLSRTWRVRVVGFPQGWQSGTPFVLAFWHAQLLMLPAARRRFPQERGARRIVALISMSSDGRIIARAARLLGIFSVAGSSSRNGREALFRLSQALQRGAHVVITPDGPKGPRECAKEGVVRVAQRGGAPILPIAAAASHVWRFNSWDRMVLPKPFARIIVRAGSPLLAPVGGSSDEVARCVQSLEAQLRALSREAEFEVAPSWDRAIEGDFAGQIQ